MIKMPNTKAGKWSVGFGVVFDVLMAVSLLVAIAVKGDPVAIAGNPLIPILNISLNLAGLLSLIFGIFAVVKYKEWPVCRYLAGLYGIAFLMFMLGEFLFPH